MAADHRFPSTSAQYNSLFEQVRSSPNRSDELTTKRIFASFDTMAAEPEPAASDAQADGHDPKPTEIEETPAEEPALMGV